MTLIAKYYSVLRIKLYKLNEGWGRLYPHYLNEIHWRNVKKSSEKAACSSYASSSCLNAPLMLISTPSPTFLNCISQTNPLKCTSFQHLFLPNIGIVIFMSWGIIKRGFEIVTVKNLPTDRNYKNCKINRIQNWLFAFWK